MSTPCPHALGTRPRKEEKAAFILKFCPFSRHLVLQILADVIVNVPCMPFTHQLEVVKPGEGLFNTT